MSERTKGVGGGGKREREREIKIVQRNRVLRSIDQTNS